MDGIYELELGIRIDYTFYIRTIEFADEDIDNKSSKMINRVSAGCFLFI